MGLFSAIDYATRGLQSTQSALSVVSQNVANAQNPNYIRKKFQPNGPLSKGEIVRVFESFIQKQMWRESASSGFTSAQAGVMSQLESLYGVPGSSSTLNARYDDFHKALQTLKIDPASPAARKGVIAAAQSVAATLNNLSDGIQSLRTSVEDQISQQTSDANSALQTIALLNEKIRLVGTTPDPDLLDRRDAALKTLSSLMDVTITEASNGSVSVSLRNGTSLLDETGARRLSFDSHSPLTAQSVYDPLPSKRSVGTISLHSTDGVQIDLIATGALKNGSIGGLIDLRDRMLVSAQSQIDDIAAGLSSALSDNEIQSTDVGGGKDISLAGLLSGNRLSLSYKDAQGQSHKITIIRVDDPSKLPLPASMSSDPNEEVVGVSMKDTTTGAIAAAIQSAVNVTGLNFTASSDGVLHVNATSSVTLTSLTARVTATSLTGSGTALPLFMDGRQPPVPFTDSLDGTSQRLGFSSRIVVNPALVADSSYLTNYTGAGGSLGDSARPTDLINRLDNTFVLSSPSSNLGLGLTPVTLSQLIQQTFVVQASEIQRVNDNYDNQKTVQAAIDSRFSSTAGVQMDVELADMTELQNAYTANARVLSTIKDMFDILMRI